jgi:hypothetical protein
MFKQLKHNMGNLRIYQIKMCYPKMCWQNKSEIILFKLKTYKLKMCCPMMFKPMVFKVKKFWLM